MKQGTNKAPKSPHLPPLQSREELQEQVSRRAYELYEARGREDGHDVDDWLRAESDVARQQSKSRAA
jgi:hypothetical protein